MDLRTLLQLISRTPASGGTIGTAGVYGAVLTAETAPLDVDYTTESGSGLAAYGDLGLVQQIALSWLRSDTATAYAALSSNGATARASASARGGLLQVLQAGAQLAGAPGTAGDVFVTGGCSAVATQAMTGSTLLTFADSSTVSVTGDGNDVYSFGCCDTISVTGTGNTVYGGPGGAAFTLSGHVNTFRGGEGCDTLTLSGANAAANIVIGGEGHLVVNSTAPVTQFIGGPGDTSMVLNGDYSSILLGNGAFTGQITGNGVNIETGAGCATLDVTSAGGGTIVTGSGTAIVRFNGSGETLMEGVASGCATFCVSGTGDSIFGGDVVNASGSGLEIRSRAEGLTGTMKGQITGVLNNMGSFASDPVVASAILAANPAFLPQSLATAAATTTTTASCGTVCSPCGGGSSIRVINLAGTSNAVYADTGYDMITVNGSSNNFYGSAAGRTVAIASGTNNLIWGSAGCNTYIGDGQNNVLEYIALPGAATSPGPVTVNLALGLAVNSYGGLDRIAGINWVEAGSGSTLLGGAAPATLSILGDNGTIRDGAGNDTLYASGSGNQLQSTVGNDLLHTGGTNNTYLIGSCLSAPGATEIKQDWVGVTGAMQFIEPVAANQLWFSADAAGDLLVQVMGSKQVVTVDNWFGANATQLSSITAGGSTIGNAGINAMVAAMSSYQSNHAGFNPATVGRLPGDSALASAYAASWHA